MGYVPAVLSILGILNHKFSSDRSIKTVVSFLLVIIAITYFGTRWHFGNDFINYNHLYHCTLENSCTVDIQWETIYRFFVTFLHSAGFGFPAFVFFISIFSISLKYFAFRNLLSSGEIYFWLYIGIYGLAIEAGSIRQGLALGFLIAAVLNLAVSRFYWSLIFIVFAVFSHISSCVVLPVFGVAFILAKTRLALWLIFLASLALFAVILAVPREFFIDGGQQFIALFGNETLTGKASFYLKNAGAYAISYSGIIQEIKHAIILIIFLAMHKMPFAKTNFFRTTFILFLFGVYLTLYLGPDSELGIRLPAYLIPFELIPIGGVIACRYVQRCEQYVFAFGMICIFILVRNFKFLNGIWAQNYSNYTSWLWF